ncbi:MAG: hypothetical protein COX57_04250 [Alphaproteobacteria bacterium CG_4_10_14_0_2_um_filter_63_37]|nr:MAG: hypothetical protein AUJ55_07875 [Proteobacteria bacterium CG1_02_64_396]PJA25254.1 MAG: hypothetical protein COX57_04250 [Alphaproteobacteria bacterium CG_4_10_14_0_2_um_filter_63_37]
MPPPGAANINPAPMAIAFGSSGVRGRLGVEITPAVIAALAQAVGEQSQGGMVIVGADCRRGREALLEAAVAGLAQGGARIERVERPLATPVLAHAVIRRGASFGINLTASHNSSEYQGFKLTGHWGGPALPDLTDRIAARAQALLDHPESPLTVAAQSTPLDPIPPYLEALRRLAPAQFQNRDLTFAPLYGVTQGIWDALARPLVRLHTLTSGRREDFGGAPPDPVEGRLRGVDPRGVQELWGCDGDGDRFGILSHGVWIPPDEIAALIVDAAMRGLIPPLKIEAGQAVARSIPSRGLLDRVCRHHGLSILETPVSFRHLAQAIAEGRAVLAVEESGGMAWSGFIPEKDGMFVLTLLLHLLAFGSLAQQVEELKERVGSVCRIGEKIPGFWEPEGASALLLELAAWGGEVVERDGVGVILPDGTMLHARPSGTEPVVRLYGVFPGAVIDAQRWSLWRSLIETTISPTV